MYTPTTRTKDVRWLIIIKFFNSDNLYSGTYYITEVYIIFLARRPIKYFTFY